MSTITRKRILIGILVAVMTAATGCGREPTATEPVRPVLSILVGDAEQIAGKRFPGQARATQEVDMAFEVQGRIIERPVDVGSEVRRGDLLARLDPRDYEADLARARANEAKAESDFRRAENLYADDAISASDLDVARRQLEVSRADIRKTEKAMEETRLVAPFDGTIAATYDVSAALRELEGRLLDSDHVDHVTTFVGQGPPRFYLPVDPESPHASYGQLIVNTPAYKDIEPLIAEFQPWIVENVPDAMVRVRKYGVGPAETWPFEARFTGPAEADVGLLRQLGARGIDLLADNPLATDIRTDMRTQVFRVVPVYDQENGRWTNVAREDIARATKRAFDGVQVGLYREGDDLHPILLRHAVEERDRAAAEMGLLQVNSPGQTRTVPLSAVTKAIRAEWEDPIIVRWNRRRAITVQGDAAGVTFPTLHASVKADFEAIDLPPGYDFIWDGEFASTVEAQDGLVPGIVPAVVIMLFIIVALFNAVRPPLIIVLTIPFAFIGISTGLLATQAAFGFVALLGAMSLAGMMIKASIVLLDQIGIERAAGKSPHATVVDSAVSRLRPVALASATTVLGVIPLLKDLFWVSMSVTIMAGLTVGTILVMVLVPVLYATLHRIPADPTARN